MSVLASKRRESKFEAITYSVELHNMLLDLMQRNFGVKDLDHLVRVRYAYGKDETEDFAKYRYLMTNFKMRIDQLASQLTSNIRAANSTYPTNMREYERRRDYQNNALVNCEQLINDVNNNGNTNYNNASNSNGVRPDSQSNQPRRRRCPFRQGEMKKPDAIYYGKYCYHGE